MGKAVELVNAATVVPVMPSKVSRAIEPPNALPTVRNARAKVIFIFTNFLGLLDPGRELHLGLPGFRVPLAMPLQFPQLLHAAVAN